MANDTLGIIGLGRMGSALLRGLLTSGYDARRVHVAEVDEAALASAADLGVWTHGSNAELAKAVETVVLAVKPTDVPQVLRDLGELRERATVISIAAGFSLSTLAGGLPLHVRVVRAMPNTPCLVQAGVTVLHAGHGVSAEEMARVTTLFAPLGLVEIVHDEALLDAVTALAASGPAFVFTALEALADGGVLMGLSRDLAHRLAVQMVLGSAELCKKRGDHPARLRDEVASPGGTTIHGLRALEAGGFRAALINAVEAASKRATEMSQQSKTKDRG